VGESESGNEGMEGRYERRSREETYEENMTDTRTKEWYRRKGRRGQRRKRRKYCKARLRKEKDNE
jgi:hypothetical protein